MKTKTLLLLLYIAVLLLTSACDVIEDYIESNNYYEYKEEPAPDTSQSPLLKGDVYGSEGTAAEATGGYPIPDFTLPIFSLDSIWNTSIELNAPIDPESDAMIERLILEHEQGANMDLSVDEWSVTVFFAYEDTPRMNVELIQYWWSYYLAIKDAPMPSEVVPDPEDDGHLAIIDLSDGYVYEFWQAEKRADGTWTASWGNRIALSSNGIYPTGNSSRGSGFASLAGMIWPEEFAQGKIEHALVVSIPSTKKGGPVPPATESDGRSSYWGAIPIGARIQLNPALDLDGYDLTSYERTICECLQEYGAFVGDTSGSIEFEAINPLSYTHDPYNGMFNERWIVLHNIPLEELRVLELPPEIKDPELGVEDESIFVMP